MRMFKNFVASLVPLAIDTWHLSLGDNTPIVWSTFSSGIARNFFQGWGGGQGPTPLYVSLYVCLYVCTIYIQIVKISEWEGGV